MIIGDFPPSSRMHLVKFLAAEAATSFPFSGEPVNTIKSNG